MKKVKLNENEWDVILLALLSTQTNGKLSKSLKKQAYEIFTKLQIAKLNRAPHSG